MKITKDEVEAHKKYDECVKLYSKYLKDKNLEEVKKEVIGMAIRIRTNEDLIEFLFRKLIEKKVLDNELYGVALNISTTASKMSLKKLLKKK